MTVYKDFAISWCAPIVPGLSLAGIPLNIDIDSFEHALLRYLVDKEHELYRFDEGPDLRLVSDLDEYGNGGYSFPILDSEIVNELKRGVPALSVLVRDRKVCAIKVYDFSFSGEPAEGFIYRGFLSGDIGLGSLVSDYCHLQA